MKIRDIVLRLHYKGEAVTLTLKEHQDDLETCSFATPRRRVVDELGPVTSLAGAGVSGDLAQSYHYERSTQTFTEGIVGIRSLEGTMKPYEVVKKIGPTDCLLFDDCEEFSGLFRHDGRGRVKSQGPWSMPADPDHAAKCRESAEKWSRREKTMTDANQH